MSIYYSVDSILLDDTARYNSILLNTIHGRLYWLTPDYSPDFPPSLDRVSAARARAVMKQRGSRTAD
eukprot:1111790-Pyramimonas_sp.AAC.1